MSTPWIGHTLKIDVEFVGIDVDKLDAAVQKMVESGMEKFRDEIEKKWRERAESTLDTSRDQYLEGLSVTHSGMDIDVKLTGWLPVAVEQGTPRFDMKPGILGTDDSRVIPLGGGMGAPKFRTMKAQSSGWWHPGIQARAISEQVKKEIPQMVKDVFEPLMSRIKV